MVKLPNIRLNEKYQTRNYCRKPKPGKTNTALEIRILNVTESREVRDRKSSKYQHLDLGTGDTSTSFLKINRVMFLIGEPSGMSLQ